MTKWAICGTGGITDKFLRAIQQIQDTQVVACASSTKQRAIEFGQNNNLIPYTYDELYQAKDIDAVYVCTNNHLHDTNTLGFLKNKIPVLCEKPFAIDFAKAKQMIEFAQVNNILLMEAMWTIYLPCIQALRQQISSKAWGNVQKIKCRFNVPHISNTAHRIHKYEFGGGVILDLGVYFVSLTYYLLGKPKSIVATSDNLKNGVDLQATVVFNYDDNLTCELDSKVDNSRDCHYKIECQNATIDVPSFNGATNYIVSDRDGKTQTQRFAPDKTNGFVYQIEHFMSLLKSGKTQSSIWEHSDTLAVMSMLDECRNQIIKQN